MDAANYVMLATAEDNVGLASFETAATAGQEGAGRLGVPVTARDPMTDEVLAAFEPA